MAGRDYSRSRYYTRSQQISDQRDDMNTIIKLKGEVTALKAEIERLTTLATELQKHCQWLNEQLKFQEASDE